MSSPCCCCGGQVKKLNQQVSVMRKEIKNLRQLLDSAVRAHRKHMTSLQSVVSKTERGGTDKCQPPPQTETAPADLEQGNIQTVPIGYISSCFSVKNGTPRQPTVCRPSRAALRVRQSVFSNPEHSLMGLEHYSHVWVIFLFHKNGHLSYKAKVKPPRLNGQRVGVYSTRSPHRPNALGLTLAKLDTIVGDTVHLSEVDMIDGTPVLDIKPYIPDYDNPHIRVNTDVEANEWDRPQPKVPAASSDEVTNTFDLHEDSGRSGSGVQSETRDHSDDPRILLSEDKSKVHILSQDVGFNSASSKSPAAAEAHVHSTLPQDLRTLLEEVKAFVTQGDALPLGSSEGNTQTSDTSKLKVAESTEDCPTRPCYREEAYSTIAGWIREPPVDSLEVRFTPHAERELGEFLPSHTPVSAGGDTRPRFRFLRGPEEAATAIRGVLSADPRSVYRRTRCPDRLFFFTLDTADITCWFGQDFAEVLRVRPVGHMLA